MCIANTPSVTIATTTRTQGKPPYRAFPSSCRATTSRRRRRLVRARQHRKPLRRHDGQVAPHAIPGVRRARLITSTPNVTQNGGKAKPQPPFWVTSRRHITMCSPLETTICAASGVVPYVELGVHGRVSANRGAAHEDDAVDTIGTPRVRTWEQRDVRQGTGWNERHLGIVGQPGNRAGHLHDCRLIGQLAVGRSLKHGLAQPRHTMHSPISPSIGRARLTGAIYFVRSEIRSRMRSTVAS